MSDSDKSAENPQPAESPAPQRQILRDEKGRILKGSAGLDRSGRPRSLRERIGQATDDGETLVEGFKAIWDGTRKMGHREVIEAGKWLSDRYWGKAVDIIANIKADPDSNEELASLVSDALIQLAGTLSRKQLSPKSEILDLDPSASLAPQNPKPPEDGQ